MDIFLEFSPLITSSYEQVLQNISLLLLTTFQQDWEGRQCQLARQAQRNGLYYKSLLTYYNCISFITMNMEGTLDFYLSNEENLPYFTNNQNITHSVQDLHSIHSHSMKMDSVNMLESNSLPPFQEPSYSEKEFQAQKKGGCKCKKTFCIKMYCECFSSSKGCGSDCGCQSCKNPHTSKIGISKLIKRQSIRKKNLEQKYCNCKKSQCIKNYCECYSSMNGCSSMCKCLGCQNKYNGQQQLQKSVNKQERRSNIMMSNIDCFIDFN